MPPSEPSPIREKLQQHFGISSAENIATVTHGYALASRVDVQIAIDLFFEHRKKPELIGVQHGFMGEATTLPQLFGRALHDFGPIQHDEIDIGVAERKRCLKNALWLSVEDGVPFVLLLTTPQRAGVNGVHLELGVPTGEVGLRLSDQFFRHIEAQVNRGSTYRGKIISLESPRQWAGSSATLKVHRLRRVTREEVILPEKTLQLIDHNVGAFIRARDHIKGLGLSGKKGLLFYGQPGTGKTHTIYYLASQLEDHTTLLITAEQVGLLDEYFRLARLLQPSVVVLEDVDLIARSREQMGNLGAQVLLNKLLNEMDGLREDADVLFILTTNHAEALEEALASRPGRIDQAIEFPLPDEPCRSRLISLYSNGAHFQPELLQSIVRRTRGASAAFIKELMRRAAQFGFEMKQNGSVDQAAIDAALEEMVFRGGPLNLKMLGGRNVEIGFTADGKT